jgi:hypothetical protein
MKIARLISRKREALSEMIYGNRCKTKSDNDYSVREDRRAIAERRNTRFGNEKSRTHTAARRIRRWTVRVSFRKRGRISIIIPRTANSARMTEYLFESKFLGVDSLAFCVGHQRSFKLSTESVLYRSRTFLTPLHLTLPLSASLKHISYDGRC